MATFRPDLSGAFPPVDDPSSLDGPLLTINDLATLAQAPQRQVGTEVTLLAKHIRPPPTISLCR